MRIHPARKAAIWVALPSLTHLLALTIDRRSDLVPNCGLPTLKRQCKPYLASAVFASYNNQNDAGSETADDPDPDKPLDRKFLERNKRWVILVDDERAIRLAVGDYLYDKGYQVTACADADAVFEVTTSTASQRPTNSTIPDAIISDIRMPGKDGIELLRMIRDDPLLKQVPVILLTAKGMTKDRIVGFQAGADAYLPKPFNPEELLSILDNLILRRQQMQGERSDLDELKQNMEDIKLLMKQNAQDLVKDTDVYLTLAERQVLELLCKGYTNAEIAAEKGISVKSVPSTITRLYQKTNTFTRTALVRWALQTGYISKR
jgi:DNA-binding NarL/FixJ family response regulator